MHPAHRVDLAREPSSRRSLGWHPLAENLDGDLLVIRILGEVHHAHAALAELLTQPVRAEALLPRVGTHRHIA
jgi:hypothetical protein